MTEGIGIILGVVLFHDHIRDAQFLYLLCINIQLHQAGTAGAKHRLVLGIDTGRVVLKVDAVDPVAQLFK